MANTNRFKINGLRLELGESEAMLPVLAAKKLGISQGDILSLRILRRSLDARKKNDIFVSYNIEAEVDGACSALLLRRGWSAMPPEQEEEIRILEEDCRRIEWSLSAQALRVWRRHMSWLSRVCALC